MFLKNNIRTPYYFVDPASPFMRAITDLHDYVFMFLVAVLIFVFYIMAVLIRNNGMIERPVYHPYNFVVNYGHAIFYLLLSKYHNIFLSNKHKIFLNAVSKINKGPIRDIEYEESKYYYKFATFMDFIKVSYKKVYFYNGLRGFFLDCNENFRDKMKIICGYLMLLPFIFVWKYFIRFGSSFTQYVIFMKFKHFFEKGFFRLDFNSLFYISRLLYRTQLRKASLISYQFTHHDTLETIWTLVPSIILIFIAIPSLLVLFALDEIGSPAITIKAVGHQWYWSYEISTTIEDENGEQILITKNFDSYMVPTDELKLGDHRNLEVDNWIKIPINTHVRMIITSMDVLHSWAIPALGVKIDAVPGRLNQLGLFVDRFGTFYGQCSEICGTNHGFMPIKIEVLPFPTVFEVYPQLFILDHVGWIVKDEKTGRYKANV
jgi:cytochrome c oxidase subunit 2